MRLILWILCACPAAGLYGQTTPDQLDHPIVNRMDGADLKGSFARSYVAYTAPVGEPDGELIPDTTVRGQLTSLIYEAGAGESSEGVFSYYYDGLTEKGFLPIYTLHTPDNKKLFADYFILNGNGANAPAQHYDLLKITPRSFHYGVFQKGDYTVVVAANQGRYRGQRAHAIVDVIESNRGK